MNTIKNIYKGKWRVTNLEKITYCLKIFGNYQMITSREFLNENAIRDHLSPFKLSIQKGILLIEN